MEGLWEWKEEVMQLQSQKVKEIIKKECKKLKDYFNI